MRVKAHATITSSVALRLTIASRLLSKSNHHLAPARFRSRMRVDPSSTSAARGALCHPSSSRPLGSDMAATARLLFRSILPALFALLVIGTAVRSDAAVFVSVAIAPPVLPVYSQPIAPGPGYIWTPGYWAYGPAGYYWVPGTWVIAPFVGALWTPGYWGWANGLYLWHAGYWGTRVGFYGGVNYGFGYVGTGFYGGY